MNLELLSELSCYIYRSLDISNSVKFRTRWLQNKNNQQTHDASAVVPSKQDSAFNKLLSFIASTIMTPHHANNLQNKSMINLTVINAKSTYYKKLLFSNKDNAKKIETYKL